MLITRSPYKCPPQTIRGNIYTVTDTTSSGILHIMRPPRYPTKTQIESNGSSPQYNLSEGQHDSFSSQVIDTNLSVWTSYFDRQIQLTIPAHEENSATNDVFNVYIAGSVHRNILLCLHGAGQTGLSWSLVANKLKSAFCVIAYDCRGHGLSKCVNPKDLSKDTLVTDGLRIIDKIREYIEKERALNPNDNTKSVVTAGQLAPNLNNKELSVRDKILRTSRQDGPTLILVGHSLGGAIAIHMAFTEKIRNLQGIIILDVVEGTAIEALPSMERFIEAFPDTFTTTEEAIEWSLLHTLSNRESATISIPSQLYFDGNLWRWRVNLAETKEFWTGWFHGISSKFLSAKIGSGGKILVLVGHERLDKELTIGHMQGKYQLLVVPKSGHIIEEDQPDDVVQAIMNFAHRFRLLS